MAGNDNQPDSQGQDPGEDEENPPLEPPLFPPPQPPQPGPTPAPNPSPLRIPPPGGLTKSPEELTRQIGWRALAEAVSTSAQQLYPQDPKAAALTVANTLQPYIQIFSPGNTTPGTGQPSNTPLSKTTESIVLGALTGTKSHEVAKYQHTFPTFPGDSCRDDVDRWEEYWESIYDCQKVVNR